MSSESHDSKDNCVHIFTNTDHPRDQLWNIRGTIMPALYSVASYIMEGQLSLQLVEHTKLLLNYWTTLKKMPNGLSVSITPYHATPNHESTNPQFFFTKLVVCFNLLKIDFCFRIKMQLYNCLFYHKMIYSWHRNHQNIRVYFFQRNFCFDFFSDFVKHIHFFEARSRFIYFF